MSSNSCQDVVDFAPPCFHKIGYEPQHLKSKAHLDSATACLCFFIIGATSIQTTTKNYHYQFVMFNNKQNVRTLINTLHFYSNFYNALHVTKIYV